MKIANGAECVRRGFHGIASSRAVDMEIDETGREIVSLEIDNLSRWRMCLLANCRNFPLCRDNLEAIANFVRKNQTRIG